MKMPKLRLFVISALVLACAVSLAAVLASLPGTAAAEEDSGCVHYSNPDADMKLALTFDDGPHPEYTDKILAILKKYGVRATFFVVGENVERYPDVVGRVIADGHELGNHTFSHANLSKLSYRKECEEIMSAENAVFEENEYRTRLLRPPGVLIMEFHSRNMIILMLIELICYEEMTCCRERLIIFFMCLEKQEMMQHIMVWNHLTKQKIIWNLHMIWHLGSCKRMETIIMSQKLMLCQRM